MWAYIPSTCSRSAQASGDLTLESAWQFEALERSAWWSGKVLASKSWHRGWRRDTCIQRLSGRMPEPSTVGSGLEWFMASLPDTHASLSVVPVSASGPVTLAISGPKSYDLCAKYDPSSSSWRKCQHTFNWDLAGSSETLPKSGMTRSGQLYARPMLELRTAASGSSSWPTPVAGDAKSCGAAGYSTESGRNQGVTLTDAARLWAGRRGLTQSGPGSPNTSTLRLNPQFVEWLMGFPVAFTDCVRLATP